ncbi:MAG: type VI secretion system baseplate subunit TssG [Gemmatimonadota bacterium]|nr:type VI secretion system baseplate subunit TssG [Gemmatimonadota bacterium]
MPDGNDASVRKLKRSLEREGPGFEFFQAMRLLMRLYPEHVAVGSWGDPTREVVRLTVPPTLSFPPAEIARLELPIEPGEDDDGPISRAKAARTQARMSVRFFGLTGPQGVLPHVYTEQASNRARARDTAFRDFLDLFHHRALSLFYRAWERHHTIVPAERGSEDRIQHHLLDLIGAGTEEVSQRSTLHTSTLAYYAGLFALRTRPAVGLAQLVADYFRIAAQIDQFVGEWQPIQDGGQVSLGGDDLDGQLGAAILGDSVFDPMAQVGLRLGPLTRVQFDAFLPGGRDCETLRQLAHYYADDQVGVRVQLVLARDEIPGAQLSAAGAPTLGFGTWLRAKPAVRDADDVSFKLC